MIPKITVDISEAEITLNEGKLSDRTDLNVAWGLRMVLPLLLLFSTNCFALTLIPQSDGNYTIIDGARVAKDIPEQTIVQNQKYHSDYWMKVNSMLTNSKKYRWNRGKANGGNFR